MQCDLSVLVELQAASSLFTHRLRTQAHTDSQQEQLQCAVHEPVCLVPGLWTSTCMCLIALFDRASTQILRAFYSADIGITTDTTSNISSTCVVLALVAGRRDCQPRPNSKVTDAIIVVTAASQSPTLLSMTVNIASEVLFNALRSLTQPCLTAYCI